MKKTVSRPAQLTPLFQQYFDLKDAYPGFIMFMRVGDFFEAYGDDAETLARDAEIVLTSKEAGGGERVAMAGVPHMSLDNYLKMMVEQGHKVAVAEQMEDARAAKGLVRRDVTRLVTAGTVTDPSMLDEGSDNFLAGIALVKGRVGLVALDISSGVFAATEMSLDERALNDELARFQPAEIVLTQEAAKNSVIQEVLAQTESVVADFSGSTTIKQAEKRIFEQFEVQSLQGFGIEGKDSVIQAAGHTLSYLARTQPSAKIALGTIRYYSHDTGLGLDATTLKNLELFETIYGSERKGSLIWAIDQTTTAMGRRLLKRWLSRPLSERQAIEERLEIVDIFCSSPEQIELLQESLKEVADLERLLGRVVAGRAGGRDLLALSNTLSQVPNLEATLTALNDRFEGYFSCLGAIEELGEYLESAVYPDPPIGLKDGNLIATGFQEEIDQLRETMASGHQWLQELEQRERERTEIKSLKVGFNNVFGYYLEVTKANLSLVPEEYQRKQTLANAERYFTAELKELESQILGAGDRLKELEYEIFSEVRAETATYDGALRATAEELAKLDVLLGFAAGALRYHWVRPLIADKPGISIEAGRHPVVEKGLNEPFVPNDCELGEDCRFILLTGPNMSGKSTFLRQTAVLVILAQVGCFVPAESATIGIVDRIFTRVGASDQLHQGQSTFMVEMAETANILRYATPRSLVILDEVGRGTSTYDGYALAQAIAEYLYAENQCFTLFATHFHELTLLAKRRKAWKNFRVAVRENRNDILFLRKIVPGGADRSYGIYVARLAGVPQEVLERATKVLEDLEKKSRLGQGQQRDIIGLQLGLFGASENTGEWIMGELQDLELESSNEEELLAKLKSWKELVSVGHDEQ